MDRSLLSASSSSSSSSSLSSSSSSLILFTCLGSVIAFGSVLIFVRRVFNPRNNDDNEDDDSENINNNNNNNNAIELERFDVNIGLGINRFRLDLNLLFQVRSQLLENAQQSRRRVNLYVRIGGNYPHEIVALLLLLLLRSQAAPILMPLLEDVEFAAISYLRTLRRPRFACRIA